MKPHVTTLSNGLRVLTIDTKSFPTLTTILLIGAGSRYENAQNNGIAHFFEHMAFKGSKRYPDSFTITSTIEGLGGKYNAFTSKDHTGYWIKSTSDNFGTVIGVLSDMILEPLLLDQEIEKEKGVIIEEINMYEDTPMWKSGDLFEELLYKGTSLGYEIAGTKDTVMSFNRQTFLDYMHELYHPDNAVLVVAGGFGGNTKSYLDQIEKAFGSWARLPVSGSFENVIEHQQKPAVLSYHKKTEQTHFCLGFRSHGFSHPSKYASSILATILGGGMSSRLFSEVREKRGLCYYISTGRTSYADVGSFVTSAGVTNSVEKTKEAIKVILKEHKKMLHGEFSKEELLKAKALIKGRTLLSMEDSQNVASFFGNELLLQKDTRTPAEIIEKIEAVTAEQVVAVAQDIFKQELLNLSIIGPYKKSDFTEHDLAF
ncbi:insulinase family protein [Candidatus Microgenomates bacterium]|nr:insulinase family protein [Candidatus Microgenomates bacterium]